MDLKFQVKQAAKMLSQNVYLPAVYDAHRLFKVERNLVIFADAHHDGRPEAMELLYRRLRKDQRIHVRQMYLDFGKASARQILEFSTKFMKRYAKASVVVICDNFLPVASCRKKDKTLVIQLWHGCGCYKKFGYDSKDDIPQGYHGDVFRNMDLVTVSAPAAALPFSSAMRKEPEQVRALGVSRTDLYYSKKWQERCQERFYDAYPQAKGKKIVLWAPTFRGNAGVPELLDLDVEKLQKQLGDDYMVLTRVHPHMKEAQKALAHNCEIPTEQLYPVVDVLIADYSSLIYEYLLMAEIRADGAAKVKNAAASGQESGRVPENVRQEDSGSVVLYVPDLEEYERKRGFYMDIHEIPGQIVKTPEELAKAIRQAAGEAEPVKAAADDAVQAAEKGPQSRDPEKERIRRKTFLETYLSACDGKATRRICQVILDHCGLH